MDTHIPIVLYTHSEYSFIWKVTISLLEKYAAGHTIYWCCDSILDYILPSNFIVYIYDPSLSWSARVKGCVDTLPSSVEYLMYIQEDWLLIDYIDNEKLSYILRFMNEKRCDVMMGEPRGPRISDITDTIYGNYKFIKITAHYGQPAIWRKSLFLKLVENDMPLSMNETGIAYDITAAANCWCIYDITSRNITIPSLFFPHMHAICNGKWTFIRYPQLKPFLESFGIDTSKRGICDTWILDYQ